MLRITNYPYPFAPPIANADHLVTQTKPLYIQENMTENAIFTKGNPPLPHLHEESTTLSGDAFPCASKNQVVYPQGA